MARGAKNPRFRADPPPAPTAGAAERRRRTDRRDPGRTSAYIGVERRSGPRRAKDLPRPVWHRPLGIGVAVALGIAAGLALGSMHRADPPPQVVAELRVDPDQLARVQAMRDEAEALTLAGVALDERAHELWMPRVAKIELALADAQTPEAIRVELDATLMALERVGVLGSR